MSNIRTVLHIGSDKTGSTALQHALADARTELANRGIVYPDLDGRPDHLEYASGARPDWRLRSDIDTVLLSSEALWPLGRKEIESVLVGLPTGPTEVVAYLRDPGTYVEAAFLQRCRMCTSERGLRAAIALLALPPALNPIARRAIRRFGQLGRWAEVAELGAVDRLVLRPYIPIRWPDGDIVADFFDAIGRADVSPLFANRKGRVQNSTPDLVAVHASVLIRSASGPQAQARFLTSYSEGALAPLPNGPTGPVVGSSLRDYVRQEALPPLAELHERHGGLEPLLALTAEERGEAPSAEGRAAVLDRDAARQLVAQFARASDEGGKR